jgi:hypothetical protein
MVDRAPGGAARYGAVAFAMWGLLHVALGISMISVGLSEGLSGSELQAESLMFFTLATVIGTASILVAIVLNWHNDTFGFWLNVWLVVPVDVALIAVLMRPGHIDAIGGAAGPVLALVAIVFAAVGQVTQRTPLQSAGVSALASATEDEDAA